MTPDERSARRAAIRASLELCPIVENDANVHPDKAAFRDALLDADRYHDLVERVEALRDELRNINIPYFNRRIADRLDKIIAGEPS